MRRVVRVLLAEDNEDHVFFITRALRSFGGVEFEIEPVRDGEEALDFLYRRNGFTDRSRPHLILLDLRMPRVAGLEVLETVKSDPELRSIPVAVLTSSDRQQDIDDSYRAGTNTYLVKRSSVDGLSATMGSLGDFWTEVAALPEPPA